MERDVTFEDVEASSSDQLVCPAKLFAARLTAFDASGGTIALDSNNPAFLCDGDCSQGPVVQQRHIGKLALPRIFAKEVCGKACEGKVSEAPEEIIAKNAK